VLEFANGRRKIENNTIKFNFNDKGLVSISLENAECILVNYIAKYKQVHLKKEEVNLIAYLGNNKYYDPSSIYIREGVTIYSEG
jgi:hypothetical protein